MFNLTLSCQPYYVYYIFSIYINNTLPPALAVHEIYRDIFGPPMEKRQFIHVLKALKQRLKVQEKDDFLAFGVN